MGVVTGHQAADHRDPGPEPRELGLATVGQHQDGTVRGNGPVAG
jgi:hypothetical protein